MKLYTKTGDGGFASLPGTGEKARKDDPRFSAIGSLDELNAAVGFCLVEAGRAGDASVVDALKPVQAELFSVGAALAEKKGSGAFLRSRHPCDEGNGSHQLKKAPDPFFSAVARMEKCIDAIYDELPELKEFILPGGCELACRLHLARTIARRAERNLVAALDLQDDEPHEASGALRYLNRLSDLLFALARQANHNAGESEVTLKS